MTLRERALRLRYNFIPDHLVGEILTKRWTDNAIPFLALVVTIAVFGSAIPGFFKPSSLSDSTRQLGEFSIVVTGMVFQETSLVPSMTVAQNLYLGSESFLNRLRGVYISAQQFLQSLNFPVDPQATVASLGAAKRQMVEIARAVKHNAAVIIFDEPTAALTPEEKRHFFALMRKPSASFMPGSSVTLINRS